MKTQTIARLFKIASTRVLGEDGQSAVYYLGNALASRVLMPDDEFTSNQSLQKAKDCFRTARRLRNITKLPPVRSSGGCRSTECEGAYLRTE